MWRETRHQAKRRTPSVGISRIRFRGSVSTPRQRPEERRAGGAPGDNAKISIPRPVRHRSDRECRKAPRFTGEPALRHARYAPDTTPHLLPASTWYFADRVWSPPVCAPEALYAAPRASPWRNVTGVPRSRATARSGRRDQGSRRGTLRSRG